MSKPTVTVGTATKKSDFDNAIKFVSQSDIIDGSSADTTLTTADFGRTVIINSASNRVIYLPSVDASHVGGWIKVIKLGAGNVTIDAADSDTIMDGAAGGTLINDVAAETKSSVLIQLASASAWIIRGGFGTWKTSASSFYPGLWSGKMPIFAGLQAEDRLILKQISTPGSPGSGYNALYPKSGNVLAFLNSSGVETLVPLASDLLPVMGSRRWGAARASNTAILQALMDIGVAGSGATQYLGSIPQFARLYPTNSANSYRELFSQNDSLKTTLANNFDLTIRAYVETLTNSRYWLGLSDLQFAALGSNPASAHLAAFRLSTDISGNWYACTKDGTTINAVSTGVASSAAWVTFRIVGRTGAVDFYINGTLTNTLTTNLPTNQMIWCFTVETLGASYSYLRFGSMTVQIDG